MAGFQPQVRMSPAAYPAPSELQRRSPLVGQIDMTESIIDGHISRRVAKGNSLPDGIVCTINNLQVAPLYGEHSVRDRVNPFHVAEAGRGHGKSGWIHFLGNTAFGDIEFPGHRIGLDDSHHASRADRTRNQGECVRIEDKKRIVSAPALRAGQMRRRLQSKLVPSGQ